MTSPLAAVTERMQSRDFYQQQLDEDSLFGGLDAPDRPSALARVCRDFTDSVAELAKAKGVPVSSLYREGTDPWFAAKIAEGATDLPPRRDYWAESLARYRASCPLPVRVDEARAA